MVTQASLVGMSSPLLLAVPNVSEGRSETTIAEIARALAGEAAPERASAEDRRAANDADTNANGVRLLDVHSDAAHHRSVFTVAGRQGELADALLRGGGAVVERVDVIAAQSDQGQHPHVGALDVVPIVYLDAAARGAACAEALTVADRIGEELRLPVFLYGELTRDGPGSGRTRAELRRGGISGLRERIAVGLPDFGPARIHPSAGATLVAARPPLVAFNLQLAPPATPDDARAIAALIREGGAEGLPGLRAIGVALSDDVAQVSMNVERPLDLPLAVVVEAVRRHAPVSSAELVGLAPRAALERFPEDLPMPGFDPARHLIENAIGW
jgi:glutamate formiminotransferase